MKKFNVAMLSDDTTMKMSYFFTVKANNPEEAIDLAKGNLRSIIIDEYDEDDLDLQEVEIELQDYTATIFELREI